MVVGVVEVEGAQQAGRSEMERSSLELHPQLEVHS